MTRMVLPRMLIIDIIIIIIPTREELARKRIKIVGKEYFPI